MKDWRKIAAALLLGVAVGMLPVTEVAAAVKGAPSAKADRRSGVKGARAVATVVSKDPAARKDTVRVQAAKERSHSAAEKTKRPVTAASLLGEKAAPAPAFVHRQTVGEPLVRVGLARSVRVTQVGSTTGFMAEKDGRNWKKFGPAAKITISLTGKELEIDGKKAGKELVLRPTGSGFLLHDGVRYRGVLRVRVAAGGNGLTVINEVPLEAYLYGVVPREVSPSWEANALKAQAVAARTYALAHRNDYRSDGYDVTATVLSQVYAGVDAETPATTAAVDATAGEVLTYEGRPIDAVFFAQAGGYTEDSENVWGGYVPYLRAVAEPENEVTKKEWRVSLRLDELEKTLKAAGKDVGQVKKIVLSPLKKGPVKAFDRTRSGRVREITVQGKKKTIRLTGNQFQQLFGLRSTLFEIRLSKGDRVEIIGRGYGHGVGMSQWGAQIMAQKNKKKDGYRSILAHFYTGVQIEKWY